METVSEVTSATSSRRAVPSRRRGVGLVGGVAAVAALATVALSACEPEPAPPPPTTTTTATSTTTTRPPTAGTDLIRLSFDEAPPAGGTYTSFTNRGSAAVAISVASRHGGTLGAGAGRDGAGGNGAVRFPAHSAATDAPRAVIRVVPEGQEVLDPGAGRFEFGADVVLDATSESGAVDSTDNGDNLVQRGLFDDVSQYKVQLDARRPSCRVKGTAGAVFVTAPVTAEPGRWYRVRCVRDGSTVSIAVTTWADDGTPTVVSRSATGPTGDMAPSRPTVPLSVGGKLSAHGEPVTSTDQLNGLVDNVILRTG